MKKTALIFLILIYCKSILGQQCDCNEALRQGTQDEIQRTTKSDFNKTLEVLFNKDFTYWESYDVSSSNSIETEASAFEIFSGSFSGNMSRSEKQAKFNSMKENYKSSLSISQSDYEFLSQKIASETVYKHWVECIELHCTNQDIMILKQTRSGNYITVTLHWVAHDNTKFKRVTYVQPINADLQDGGNLFARNSIQSQGSLSSTYKVTNPHEDFVLNVDVEGYDIHPIIVPGIEDENQNNSLPIGTIISSVLDWKRFCQINHLPEVLNYSDKKSKWAPADGRPVIGSEYGKIENNVPDLRGTFIRGINDFGVPGVQAVEAKQADPDGLRKAGNHQEDAIIEHTHDFPYGSWQTNAKGGDNRSYVGTDTKQAWTTKGVNEHKSTTETRPKNTAVYFYIKIN